MNPQQRRDFLKCSTTALLGVSLADRSQLLAGALGDIKVGVIPMATPSWWRERGTESIECSKTPGVSSLNYVVAR